MVGTKYVLQFAPALCLPGGEAGALRLVRSVNLEDVLMVEKMNREEDLRDGNMAMSGRVMASALEDLEQDTEELVSDTASTL